MEKYIKVPIQFDFKKNLLLCNSDFSINSMVIFGIKDGKATKINFCIVYVDDDRSDDMYNTIMLQPVHSKYCSYDSYIMHADRFIKYDY